MQTVNRSALLGSSSLLAGKPVFQARPASGKAGRSVGSVTVAAEVLRYDLHNFCMLVNHTLALNANTVRPSGGRTVMAVILEE